MITTYTVKLICPTCRKHYTERRLKPYKVRRHKICPECKEGRVKVLASGGKGEAKCETCRFFSDCDSSQTRKEVGWWGKCGLGYTSDADDMEPMELVYSDDVCRKHEEEEE